MFNFLKQTINKMLYLFNQTRKKLNKMTAVEFNYQVTQQQHNLKMFAQSLTSNSDDASDLLQDTILKAIKYREKFIDPTNLKAWLFTIMKNTFINNYRRKQRVQMIVDTSGEGYLIDMGRQSKQYSAEANLNLERIVQEVNRLEPGLKLPFMKHFEGFKYKEIAEELDLPIGTVKSRIFAARKQLMKALPDFDPNQP